MGGRQPKSIFTDQDQAMANAINMVFNESRHQLCLWHISKNAQKNLVGIYGVPDFNQRFNHCLYGGCSNEMEFESTWSKMIEMHNLKDNTWLDRLYQIREKWCPTFNLNFFSAKMKSTQRSESTNSVFHQIMKTSMPLIEVINFYEEKAAQMQQDEINEDFRCKNGAPGKVHKHGGILSHAVKVYTLALFGMFEEEFNSSMGLNCVETNHCDDNFTYSLSSGESRRIHIIHFNRAELSICCDCKLFETLGLLCCHALRVFLLNNVHNILDKYISNRWTKDAKKRLCYSIDSLKSNEKSTHVLRMSNLSLLWYKCCDKAAFTDHGSKIAMDSLSELLCKLEKSSTDTNKVEDVGKKCPQDLIHDDDVQPCLDGKRPILDPPHVRKKGITNVRIKSQLEKKQRKKKVKDATTSKAPTTISMVHENVQSSFLPLEMSIANPVVSSTTMLQENHLKKRNIRKVKDTTTSQASEAISMVHDVQTSFFPPEMFAAYPMINSTRMFQESTSMSHLNQGPTKNF